MDSTDIAIQFDAQGICNHCRDFDNRRSSGNGGANPALLDAVVREIRRVGKNASYDCVIGVSGGVDSTWVAYLVRKLGLRPIAVHLDNGWNSELAVQNIEHCLKKLNIDLVTVVLDWEEFRDLQLSFLRSSVPNAEIPTDHAIIASLFHVADAHGIRYVVGGDNIATEGVMPASWMYDARDSRFLKDIHRSFGTSPLRTFPTASLFRFGYYGLVKRMKYVRLLDLVEYDKAEAKQTIQQELEWKDYGGKHYESRFTRFFQSYLLPVKFGFDKRRPHLSSLILSGQIAREEALRELERPLWHDKELETEIQFFCKKMQITRDEFEQIMRKPSASHRDFASNRWLFEASGIKQRVRQLMTPKSMAAKASTSVDR